MIVVDTNVIIYLYLPSPFTNAAQAALVKDARWIAPHLWRSEVRNVLSRYVSQHQLTLDLALNIMQEAEILLQQNEYESKSTQILQLAFASGCTAYDCEFVALAQNFNIPLVTMDRQVLRAFPQTALALDRFAV
ncbi:hypothetical protein BH10CHL1_BH10CHL1_29430 [soil metagenome]